MYTPCSLGLSATGQQYFSLRTNQPPATSQQYFYHRTNQHQPSATSQTNMLIDLISTHYTDRLETGSERKKITKNSKCPLHVP
jgi:hypothetical protein